MPDTNDKIKALYDAASQKFDIGTEQDFRQKLTDPTKRKAFYDAASADFDLGTYDEYEKKLGPTQKQIDEGKAMAAKVPSFKDFAEQRGVYVPKVGEIRVTSDIAERLPSLSRKAEIAKDVQEAPERIKVREEKKEKAKVDALKNSTIKALTASGTKFTEGDAIYKKMQQTVSSAVESGGMVLSADAAGNPVYKRSAGIIESFINNVEASRKDIKDSEVFRKSNDAESVKIAEEIIKGIEQESVPSGAAAEISGMFGSAAPLLGRAVIGGGAAAKFLPGPAKAVTALGSFLTTISPSYDQAYKQGAVELYAKGIEEMKRQKRIGGLSDELTQQEKEEAMRMAKNEAGVSGFAEGIFVAGLSSIPLGSSVAGQSFKKAMVNFAKNTAKEVPRNVTLGAASEAIKDISAANAGYNITDAETLNSILERSGQDAITTLAFEVGFNIKDVANVPKYVKAAATNYLSTIPTPEFNNFAKDLEAKGVVEPGFAEKATADVNKFKESKAKVASFIPEEDMPSFAGLIEKKTNLENQKKSTDPAFHAKIDEQIAAVDARIKAMQESPNPIFDEVDELTGDTGDAAPITETEIEKSIEYADGFITELKPEQAVELFRSEERKELESAIPNIEQYKVDGVVDRTKITNEEDLAKFDEIYDRYDKLITPLLGATKEAGATTTLFNIDGNEKFFHASPNKITGPLKKSTAKGLGTGVYFSTNKDLVKSEFGENVTEVSLNIENPVYTNTKEWNDVQSLAIKLADSDYGKKKGLTLEEGETFHRYDSENFSEIDEIPSEFISKAAQELGHDAIIDKGSAAYDNEILVLDESKIQYKEEPVFEEAPKESALPMLIDNPLKDVQSTSKALVEMATDKKTLFRGFGGNTKKIQTDKFGDNITYLTDNADYANSFSLDDLGGMEYARAKNGGLDAYRIEDLKTHKVTESQYYKQASDFVGKNVNALATADLNKFNDKIRGDGFDAIEIERVEPNYPEEGIARQRNNDFVTEFLIFDKTKVKKAEGVGDILGKSVTSKNAKKYSEEYHRAKEDGSNPELVKAVENLLSNQQQKISEAPTEPSPFRPVEGFEGFEVKTKEGKKERYVNPDKVLASSTIRMKNRAEQDAIIDEIGEPRDARQVAMIALMGKPNISYESYIKETGFGQGEVKTRRGKQTEVAASPFTRKEGNTVEGVAEFWWDNLPEELRDRMDSQDIRNEIIDLLGTYKDQNEIRDAYIEDYSPKEISDEEAMNFFSRYAEEINPIEKEWEDWGMERGEKEMALELDENYVDKLIEQYESTKEVAEPTGRKKEGVVEEAGGTYAAKEKGVIEGGDVKKYIDEQATPEESTDFDGFAKKELAKEGFDAEYKSARVEGETKEQYLIRKYCK